MNFKRNLLFISLILCILISLSAVSANENLEDSDYLDSAGDNDLSVDAISEGTDLSSDAIYADNDLSEDASNEIISSDSDAINYMAKDNGEKKTACLEDAGANGNDIFSQPVNSDGDTESSDVIKANNLGDGNTVYTSLRVSSKKAYKDTTFTLKVYVNGLNESVGSVQIYKNGKYFSSKAVENGVATFSFRATSLGKIPFYAYYTGGTSPNGTYYSYAYSDEQTVTINAKAKIIVNGIYTFYNSVRKFTIKVNNTVTGKGDRYAKIRVVIYKNKKAVYSQIVTTNEKGVYKGAIKLDVGTYKMVVKMASEHYKSNNASANIRVVKAWDKITAYKHSTWQGGKSRLFATVIDIRKRPLNVGYVKFTVNGKTYKVKVKKGVASLYVKLPVGSYKYTAKYIHKNYYYKSSRSKVIVKKNLNTKILAKNIVVNVPKYRVYKIALKNKAGKAIKKTLVTLKIGKNTFKAKTNKNGVATFKMLYSKIKKSERSKAYKVTVRVIKNKNVKTLSANKLSLIFDGKTFNRRTSKKGYAVFKVKKPAAVRKYLVSLKTSSNRAVPKSSIYLKVNRKTFKATTNAYGNALFKINNLNRNAKYKTAITFPGKVKYNRSVKSTYITIKDR